ncbi:MAG: hypothetical protein ACREMB_10380, partial [Candidatus Rokuibacteriota bacterium]
AVPDPPAMRPIALAAALASLAGPTGAVLYETGRVPLFGSAPALEPWLVPARAAGGLGVGVLSSYRGARVAGIVCLFTNTAVLALYGFLAAFFALGGSR